ncbi:hypothetical protein ATANTOWER_004123 [Ataeniobius toweri]|uniref:Uncharacterized protein n=1 Tax=Ataeniobius toweri TaxID=208326 RepID=A0ABU7AMV9_9TELE|nr:hypothetical protein [Ataeniobius toweri]
MIIPRTLNTSNLNTSAPHSFTIPPVFLSFLLMDVYFQSPSVQSIPSPLQAFLHWFPNITKDHNIICIHHNLRTLPRQGLVFSFYIYIIVAFCNNLMPYLFSRSMN